MNSPASWVHCQETSSIIEHNQTISQPSEDDRSPNIGLTGLLYRACALQLSRFREHLKTSPASQSAIVDKFSCEVTRFRLFGASFDDGKLESCLDDEELFTAILRHLLSIALVLNKHPAVFNQALESLIDRSRSILSTSVCDDDFTDSEDYDSEDNETLPKERADEFRSLVSLTHHISMLMELLPTLEAVYRLTHAAGPKHTSRADFGVTSVATPYVSHVRDKYPQASSKLADRLGEANWQRHERLRSQVSQGPKADATAVQARTLFQLVSIFEDSALGSSLRSRMEKAASVASHSSFLSSAAGDKNTKIGVPKMPEGAKWGSAFPCPFCRSMVDISTRVAWKMHVYSDLQAYICTWEACPDSFVTFGARKDWAQHEIDHHLSDNMYQCSICLALVKDEQDFLHHVESVHGITTAPGLRQATIVTARCRVLRDLTGVRCNLCLKRGFTDERAYSTHVGRHLENIALIALPPTRDDDDTEDESQEENETRGSHDTLHPLSPLPTQTPTFMLTLEQDRPPQADIDDIPRFLKRFGNYKHLVQAVSNNSAAQEELSRLSVTQDAHKPTLSRPSPSQCSVFLPNEDNSVLEAHSSSTTESPSNLQSQKHSEIQSDGDHERVTNKKVSLDQLGSSVEDSNGVSTASKMRRKSVRHVEACRFCRERKIICVGVCDPERNKRCETCTERNLPCGFATGDRRNSPSRDAMSRPLTPPLEDINSTWVSTWNPHLPNPKPTLESFPTVKEPTTDVPGPEDDGTHHHSSTKPSNATLETDASPQQ